MRPYPCRKVRHIARRAATTIRVPHNGNHANHTGGYIPKFARQLSLPLGPFSARSELRAIQSFGSLISAIKRCARFLLRILSLLCRTDQTAFVKRRVIRSAERSRLKSSSCCRYRVISFFLNVCDENYRSTEIRDLLEQRDKHRSSRNRSALQHFATDE